MFDYHTHGHFSFDCEIDLEEMVQAGINAGLVQLALTDHFEPQYPNLSKRVSFDFADYHRTISALQERYRGEIQIKKGIELGLQPDVIPLMNTRLAGEKFDFIIGSVHYVGQYELCDPAFYASRTPEEAYRTFYSLCLETLTGFDNYDVMGHINIIDRYAPAAPAPERYLDLIRALFAHIIRSGKGIELNTSCFRYEMRGILTPTPDMLRLYREMGGRYITVGADAHAPRDVASGIGRAYRLLQELGYDGVTVYENRIPTQIPFSALI